MTDELKNENLVSLENASVMGSFSKFFCLTPKT